MHQLLCTTHCLVSPLEKLFLDQCTNAGKLTYTVTPLILLASTVAIECLAPDCTSHSTLHWLLFDLVLRRFTPFFAFTL